MTSIVRRGVAELVPYPPGKPIEELERELGISGSIKLASNENPLGPSPLAVKAVVDKAAGLNRYPDGSGYYLKNRLSRHAGVPVRRIILGNGSNELIELAVRTFLSEGDEAVQPFPTFLVYEKVVQGAGGNMVTVPLSGFSIDPARIVEALTARTRMVFIANPNNPTGQALAGGEVREFLKAVPENVVVLLDEAYIEFVTQHDAADGLRLLDVHPLLFVLRTFSKLYGLAGLRVGYGVASEEMVDYMNRVRQPFNVNALAQAGAAAALDDAAFVSRTLEVVREGLRYLFARFRQMGLEPVPTQTNFFLVRVPGARRIYEGMLREGVIVRSMEAYGLPDYIRINAGLPEENERCVEALEQVLARLQVGTRP